MLPNYWKQKSGESLDSVSFVSYRKCQFGQFSVVRRPADRISLFSHFFLLSSIGPSVSLSVCPSHPLLCLRLFRLCLCLCRCRFPAMKPRAWQYSHNETNNVVISLSSHLVPNAGKAQQAPKASKASKAPNVLMSNWIRRDVCNDDPEGRLCAFLPSPAPEANEPTAESESQNVDNYKALDCVRLR